MEGFKTVRSDNHDLAAPIGGKDQPPNMAWRWSVVGRPIAGLTVWLLVQCHFPCTRPTRPHCLSTWGGKREHPGEKNRHRKHATRCQDMAGHGPAKLLAASLDRPCRRGTKATHGEIHRSWHASPIGGSFHLSTLAGRFWPTAPSHWPRWGSTIAWFRRLDGGCRGHADHPISCGQRKPADEFGGQLGRSDPASGARCLRPDLPRWTSQP